MEDKLKDISLQKCKFLEEIIRRTYRLSKTKGDLGIEEQILSDIQILNEFYDQNSVGYFSVHLDKSQNKPTQKKKSPEFRGAVEKFNVNSCPSLKPIKEFEKHNDYLIDMAGKFTDHLNKKRLAVDIKFDTPSKKRKHSQSDNDGSQDLQDEVKYPSRLYEKLIFGLSGFKQGSKEMNDIIKNVDDLGEILQKKIELSEDVTQITHLIIKENCFSIESFSKILNLKAFLRGCWIGYPNWISDSLKEKQLLFDEKYGVMAFSSPIENIKFYIDPGTLDNPSNLTKEVIEVIQLGGGQLVEQQEAHVTLSTNFGLDLLTLLQLIYKALEK